MIMLVSESCVTRTEQCQSRQQDPLGPESHYHSQPVAVDGAAEPALPQVLTACASLPHPSQRPAAHSTRRSLKHSRSSGQHPCMQHLSITIGMCSSVAKAPIARRVHTDCKRGMPNLPDGSGPLCCTSCTFSHPKFSGLFPAVPHQALRCKAAMQAGEGQCMFSFCCQDGR
jgi:hypothetical protein